MISDHPFLRNIWIAAALAVARTLLGSVLFQPESGFAPQNVSWFVIMLALPHAMAAHLGLHTPWSYGFSISAYFLIGLVFLWTRSSFRK